MSRLGGQFRFLQNGGVSGDFQRFLPLKPPHDLRGHRDVGMFLRILPFVQRQTLLDFRKLLTALDDLRLQPILAALQRIQLHKWCHNCSFLSTIPRPIFP